MATSPPSTAVLECCYCGNKAPHTLRSAYEHPMFFDQVDENKWFETYTWLSYSCETCGGLSTFGEFFEYWEDVAALERAKIHPRGPALLSPPHTLEPSQPIPEKVLQLYREVWPLKHRAPSAFVGQVRRLLEFICVDQKAHGKDLFAKLQDLSQKGVFPGYFSNITDLLRKVGNMGAHAAEDELNIWDAELIDDFFRSIVEYVYIAPARIRRMESRLEMHERNGKS